MQMTLLAELQAHLLCRKHGCQQGQAARGVGSHSLRDEMGKAVDAGFSGFREGSSSKRAGWVQGDTSRDTGSRCEQQSALWAAGPVPAEGLCALITALVGSLVLGKTLLVLQINISRCF